MCACLPACMPTSKLLCSLPPESAWLACPPGTWRLARLAEGAEACAVSHSLPCCAAGLHVDEVDAAQWRALQAVAQLALAGAGTPSNGQAGAANGALRQLQQLADSGQQQPGSLAGPHLDLSAALLPTMLQLQEAPISADSTLAQVLALPHSCSE